MCSEIEKDMTDYIANPTMDKLELIVHNFDSISQDKKMQFIQNVWEIATYASQDFLYLHLGMWFMVLERYAEAQYYLKLWHERNPDHIDGLAKLQYVAVKRYDVNLAWQYTEELEKNNAPKEKILSAKILLYLISGRDTDAQTTAHELIRHMTCPFSASLVYDVSMRVNDHYLLAACLLSPYGKGFITDRNEQNLKSVLLQGLLGIIRGIGESQ